MEYGFDGVELRTERLVLRPFSFEDVDQYFEYVRDPEVSRYLVTPIPYTRRRAEEDVAGSILNLEARTPNFAVVLGDGLIGDLWLDINRENGVGELGFAIARGHWGKGLATEASTALIDWGFSTQSLAKIGARSDPRNRAALRVMEKLNMTREGVLRSHIPRNGQRVDLAVYGVLRDEWESLP